MYLIFVVPTTEVSTVPTTVKFFFLFNFLPVKEVRVTNDFGLNLVPNSIIIGLSAVITTRLSITVNFFVTTFDFPFVSVTLYLTL